MRNQAPHRPQPPLRGTQRLRGSHTHLPQTARHPRQRRVPSKTIRGVKKYLIAKVDYDQHNRENKEDSKLFVPEIF